jgi:hypothetical protein
LVEDLTLPSRAAKGLSGGVAHLIAMASLIASKCHSGVDMMKEMGEAKIPPVAMMSARMEISSREVLGGESVMFHDVPSEEAEEMIEKTLFRANMKIMADATSYEGWRDLPMTYILTMEDRSLPPAMQRRCVRDMMQLAGGRISGLSGQATRRISTRHRRSWTLLLKMYLEKLFFSSRIS